MEPGGSPKHVIAAAAPIAGALPRMHVVRFDTRTDFTRITGHPVGISTSQFPTFQGLLTQKSICEHIDAKPRQFCKSDVSLR
jgi:hypothetical protein